MVEQDNHICLQDSLRKFASMSPEAIESFTPCFGISTPDLSTSHILELILSDYGYVCLGQTLLPHNLDAIGIQDDNASFFISAEKNIKEQNRLKSRLLGDIILGNIDLKREIIIVYHQKKPFTHNSTDRWMRDFINNQLVPISSSDNPFVIGMQSAFNNRIDLWCRQHLSKIKQFQYHQ